MEEPVNPLSHFDERADIGDFLDLSGQPFPYGKFLFQPFPGILADRLRPRETRPC
jgi:hypothetical protein